LAVIVILLVLFVVSQNPKVISATVSPEVIVKGQNQEVTVTAVVKPRGFIPPVVRVLLVEKGKMSPYKDDVGNMKFIGKSVHLGWLKKTGNDNNGNSIYQNTFTINHSTSETVQIQVRNLLNTQLRPEYTPTSWHDLRGDIPSMRLAVSTRKFSLPSDPGKENDKTFEGIDSDHDGLRDDLQREIFFAFPESERKRVGTMRQVIIWVQRLRNADNKILVNDYVKKSFVAGDCIGAFQIQGTNIGNFWLVERLLTDGNSLRMDAYLRASKLRDSIIWEQTEPLESNCDFDWQSLPD
jgi:hypothetical protein